MRLNCVTMAASSTLTQGGDPSTNNTSLGLELSGPEAGFQPGLLLTWHTWKVPFVQRDDTDRHQVNPRYKHLQIETFRPDRSTKAGTFFAATQSASVPHQQHPCNTPVQCSFHTRLCVKLPACSGTHRAETQTVSFFPTLHSLAFIPFRSP